MDFFDALEALPEDNFFEQLHKLDPMRIPDKVGDLFMIRGYGYGQRVWEVIRVNPRGDITYTSLGSVPDNKGKYMEIGFINNYALRLYAALGVMMNR